MQDAFGIVIFVVVGIGAVIAIVSLFGRGRLYDDIGRGGLSIGEDRDMRPRASVEPAAGGADPRPSATTRSARCSRRATPAGPPRAARRSMSRPSSRSSPGRRRSRDPEILEEVRTLVQARNARRIARGEEPLDVDAEIARQLRDLPG